ncbi:hypothetical protein F2Q69_00003306 [Brassica cretica]|uniref:RNase H type-1 domain-containing protein n=1 Tax=Brassica cretica TaxID=69181 RepID=A0A8S9P7H4_BRACR|nr:hypothetical protein F2Q69_00003306 [Brassica cretica]
MSHTIPKVSLSSSPMDLLVAGASVPPCLPPKPPDADLDMMLPVDPPDPPVPPDPPPLPALWVFHRQISTLTKSRSAYVSCVAIRVYTVFAPFLMNISVKSRQRRHFPTSRSYGSHRRMVLSVTFLFVEVKESPPGHDLEAPVHGSLGHCYIGFPLLAKATAMRSALCLELTLEFPKLKAFSDNSTLIRAISSNLESKEVIRIVSNIHSISSGFASIGFSHLPRSKNSIVDTLAKKTLHTFSYVEWTPEFGPCFGSILSFYY